MPLWYGGLAMTTDVWRVVCCGLRGWHGGIVRNDKWTAPPSFDLETPDRT